MKKCFDNKVIPNNNIGFCDCCYSENVEIEICPSNNKCEYAMCKKCINNIEKKTKSNRCPACREEIITIKSINLEEPETNEDNIRRVWSIHICCCECGFIGSEPSTCYEQFKIFSGCLNMMCCCVYNQLKKYNDHRAAVLYSLLIHLTLLMIGRTVHYELYFEDKVYWCAWYIFIFNGMIGIAISICFTVIVILVLGCLYQSCCVEDDF